MGASCTKNSTPIDSITEKNTEKKNDACLKIPGTSTQKNSDFLKSKFSLKQITDPVLIIEKLCSEELNQALIDGFNLEDEINNLKEMDIDLLMKLDTYLKNKISSIIKTHDETIFEGKIDFLLFCFKEFRKNYLAICPPISSNLAMEFCLAFTETYTLIIQTLKEGEKIKNSHESINSKWFFNRLSCKTDLVYLGSKIDKIKRSMKKNFPHLKKHLNENGDINKKSQENGKREHNQVVIKDFIDSVFKNASDEFNTNNLKKKNGNEKTKSRLSLNTEHFIDNWAVNHADFFGKESDNQVFKCMLYNFSIQMMKK